MKVIGLTGSFGTGKTFVASIFRSLGATVIDADRIAHDAIGRGRQAHKKIVSFFGRQILDKDGEVNRKRLAGKVFGNKKALASLNRIVHPDVIRTINACIKKAGPGDVVVVDAPLLVEAGLVGMADLVVVVKSSERRQVERCSRKFSMSKEDVMKRIKGQIPITRKIKLADFVVDNDGSRSETRKRVKKIWKEIVWR